MFGLLGSAFSFLTGIAPAISGYLSTAKNVEATEFASMTTAEQGEWAASQQALIAANQAKVQNNASKVAHLFIFLFGLPPALHLGAVFITATFQGLGVAVYPMQGTLAQIEKDIAESFFILAPALPLAQALATRLRG